MYSRKLFCIVISLLLALSAVAQTKVLNTSGESLVGAMIMNSEGRPIGFVDNEGKIPSGLPYPMTVHCLGYEDVVVEGPVAQIEMPEKTYELRELSVRPGDRPYCRVMCYIRETSGIECRTDTAIIKAQYMADYMLKLNKTKKDKKDKNIPLWETPRILNSQIDDFTATGKILGKTQKDKFSFVESATMPYSSEFPELFQGLKAGNKSVKAKKTGMDKLKYHLSPKYYSIRKDNVADYKNHVYSPNAFKLLGLTMNVLESLEYYVYEYDEDEQYDVRNPKAMTFSNKMIAKGKMWYKMQDDPDPNTVPIDCNTYVEVYPISVEYLTLEEAQEVRSNREKIDFAIPAGL